MPTYEYACQACDNTWEAEQRITEAPLTDCPKCGAPKAQRLISGSRFVLKGGGWYADGYGSKPSKSSDAKSSDSKSGDTKSSDTKSDAKSGDTKSSDTKSGSDASATSSSSSSTPTES